MTLEEQAARLSQADIVALLRRQEALEVRNAELQRQNEWFKRQLFGRKSERRLLTPEAHQFEQSGAHRSTSSFWGICSARGRPGTGAASSF